jgi:UDP-N-acetylglucosamine transferase subunit ALG13
VDLVSNPLVAVVLHLRVAHLGHGDFAAKLLGGSRLMTARDQQMHDQLVDEHSEQLGTRLCQELRAQGATTPTRDLAEQVVLRIDRET